MFETVLPSELVQTYVYGGVPPNGVILTPPVDPPKQFTFEIIPELLTGLGADTTYAPLTEHPDTLSITLTV
jgi:hypothetical protein